MVVETVSGKVSGAMENGVWAFKGIPYAKAPTGDLRFKAPQPRDPWPGIRDAVPYGPISVQFSKLLNPGEKASEDSLSLNIWTPRLGESKCPVMLWIHGGAFSMGSGSQAMYNGSKLALAGDAVVVSINYRLGALGFLYFDRLRGFEPDGFDDNVGLRDQWAAIRWVHANIERFGGDPKRMTVFGESAGATSILALIRHPEASSYLSGAITQSPSPQSLWSEEEATRFTGDFIRELGVDERDLSPLKKLGTHSFNAVTLRFFKKYKNWAARLFVPTSSSRFVERALFLPAHVPSKVPLLIGTNAQEANLFRYDPLALIPTRHELFSPILEKFPLAVREKIISSYSPRDGHASGLKLATDAGWRVPCIRFADSHSAHAKVWMYRFDWSNLPLNMAGLKAFHGLEIAFVFDMPWQSWLSKLAKVMEDRETRQLKSYMQQSWVNFARFQDPNGEGKQAWPDYDTDKRYTMLLNRKNKLVSDPEVEKRVLWERIDLRMMFG